MPGKTSKIKLDAALARREPASGRTSVLPGGWWLWCLLGLGLGLGVWIGGRRYLRSELALQLTSAESGQEALASIDALMQLEGEAAVDVSRALAHPDFIVAHAAYRALNEQLDAWSKLETADRTERMDRLLSELERVPRECDQDHRILVIGLASRLYADALSSRDPSAGELLDRCRRLMDRQSSASFNSALAGNGLAPIESSLSDAAGSGEAGHLEPGSVPAPLPPLENAGPRTTAELSDQAMTAERVATRAEPVPSLLQSEMPRLSSTADQRTSSDAARVHLTGASSRQATLVDRSAAMTLSDSHLAQSSTGQPSSGSQDAHDPKLRVAQPFDASGMDGSIGINDSAPSAAVEASSDRVSDKEQEALAGIDNQPIDQLVRLLSSQQPRVAQAAALALRRKGMSDGKLNLAMQLAVGSSAERLQLLQSLGQRSDVDPRPWLLWMAADGNEMVREQAVGMLAPLLDQDVRRQLRLLLSQERDERVAQTIRRVLVQ